MQLQANGVTLEIDDQGPPAGPPLLLVMGLGMQLIGWPDGFVAQLVKAGFRVIRYDHRDIGLSQRFDSSGTPKLWWQALRAGARLPLATAYTLADLADDAAALLDALGLRSAHVCGASMGGMVVQHLAARHPDRVRSLTLMMTTSGDPRLPGPEWRLRAALLAPPPASDRVDAVVAHYARIYRRIGSPGFAPEEGALRARVAAAVSRSHRPDSVTRQLVAIAADGDRTTLLRQIDIDVPVQIIHGMDDPLIPVAAAADLLAKMPRAEADLIEGMGHDLPEALWPRFVADLRDVASRSRRT